MVDVGGGLDGLIVKVGADFGDQLAVLFKIEIAIELLAQGCCVLAWDIHLLSTFRLRCDSLYSCNQKFFKLVYRQAFYRVKKSLL